MEEFLKNEQTKDLSRSEDAHRYYTYTWDAVYTLAYALEQTDTELQRRGLGISLDDYKYFDNETEIIPQLITDFMSETNFDGVSVSGYGMLGHTK